MPTYDYVCEKCQKEFEVFQSMKDPRLENCPDEECGGSVRRKIGTGAGIIFKGSGFYETDYRSDSYKEAKKKDSAQSDSSGSDSSSKGKEKSSSGDSASKPAKSESTSKSAGSTSGSSGS